MGQINTNNYPTVSSLADADLLIVENATHGTGTTTPKQLRENAIGTDPLQTTAQTVTGAINEIFEMATDTVVGLELGKMTSFSDGVIVTDIDLHRAPVAGDRILFYHSTAVASPSSLTTYNDGVAVTTTIGDFSMTHPAGLTLMKCVALGESLRWQTVQDIADGGYTAGIGISINGTTINNSAPQLGDDIAYSKVETVTSGALGYFSADADCLVMDFRTDAEPYNGGYTLRLTTTGASFKYATLKDKAGNPYAEEIPSGSLVLCKSNVSGTGSEADPVVVTVLEIGNVEMAHDVEVLKDICITEKTATGNPVTVTDALPYNAVSLSAEIEASQDLHGYDKPWVGGADRNLLPDTYTAQSASAFGLTVTKVDNGLRFVGAPNWNTQTSQFRAASSSNIATLYADGASPACFLKSNNQYINIDSCRIDGNDIIVVANTTATTTSIDFTLEFMMYKGTAPTAFRPYSNICPISGRTSVTITDVDAESQTATVTIQLGQTVYGGTLNVTSGELTVTHALVDLGTLTYQKNGNNNKAFSTAGLQSTIEPCDWRTGVSTAICSQYTADTGDHVYRLTTDGTFGVDPSGQVYFYDARYESETAENIKTALSGVQLCYPLATPTTIQLTPEQLTMLKGYNRLSCDGGGDITLTYKADRIAAIEAALAELQ